MWQTMIEDIDAISIGLRRRLTLSDVPLVADRPPLSIACFMGETWARSQLKKSKMLISMVGAVGIEPTTSPV
jgi:hypothetical protein